jgi:hypothetical protein
VLGSLAYLLVPKELRTKFEDKAKRGILVGYKASNIYIIYDPVKNQLKDVRDVVIKEGYKYDFKNSSSNNSTNDLIISDFIDRNPWEMVFESEDTSPDPKDINQGSNNNNNNYTPEPIDQGSDNNSDSDDEHYTPKPAPLRRSDRLSKPSLKIREQLSNINLLASLAYIKDIKDASPDNEALQKVVVDRPANYTPEYKEPNNYKDILEDKYKDLWIFFIFFYTLYSAIMLATREI